jgi:hypothetical protein
MIRCFYHKAETVIILQLLQANSGIVSSLEHCQYCLYCLPSITLSLILNSTNSIPVNVQQTREGLVHQARSVLHPGTVQGHTCVGLGVSHSACFNKCTVLWTVMLCTTIRKYRACGWRKRSRLKRYYLTTRSHKVTWQNVTISKAKAVKTSDITALK